MVGFSLGGVDVAFGVYEFGLLKWPTINHNLISLHFKQALFSHKRRICQEDQIQSLYMLYYGKNEWFKRFQFG